MKTTTTIIRFLFMALLSTSMFAQDKTTVRANSSDISDNLDLRAIASIFGDASNLEDFENKINDPKAQISNLDLNNDNYVDYLRVIESVEGNAHLIIIQSVLEKDTYQDVATIEVEKDRNNNIQVQVVGNVYMYGENYIYEPNYIHTPVIYTSFWAQNYRPYYSNWYWNYYPNYYYAWNPFPIFRYRNHIELYINFGHSYHYANHRSCHTAYGMYYGRRSYAYETRHPNSSFFHRNHGYSNRHELNNNRPTTHVRPRNEIASNNPRNSVNPRPNTPRENASPRTSTTPRGNGPREATTPRNNNSNNFEPRTNSPRGNSPKATSSPRGQSQPKSSTPRSSSNGRNGR